MANTSRISQTVLRGLCFHLIVEVSYALEIHAALGLDRFASREH